MTFVQGRSDRERNSLVYVADYYRTNDKDTDVPVYLYERVLIDLGERGYDLSRCGGAMSVRRKCPIHLRRTPSLAMEYARISILPALG